MHTLLTPLSFLGLVNMKSKAESMLAIFMAALWMSTFIIIIVSKKDNITLNNNIAFNFFYNLF